jgi:hypothetical protein
VGACRPASRRFRAGSRTTSSCGSRVGERWVAGDTLVDFGEGLTIHEPWLSTTREQLRPLLDLPVEHVLATHGGPHDSAALRHALAA